MPYTPQFSDPSQSKLRQALNQAKRFYSPKKIIKAAALLCKDGWTYSDTALRDFLSSADHELSKKNYDAFAAFWLFSPLGRVLRRADQAEAQPFDQITQELASGQESLPKGKTVDGLYYVYHGSYVKAEHYAVRVFEIDSADDHILTVKDTVRDEKAAREGDRRSTGAMVFVDSMPQIVLYGLENKRGFSLMFGTEADYDEAHRLDRVVGAFLVKNKNAAIAYRRFLMIRQPTGDRAGMIDGSGIFTRDELRAPHRKHHSEAFDKLARLQATETPFTPPILDYRTDEKG